MAKLVLYGPDTKYGARIKKGFTRYLYYIAWTEAGRNRERSTGYGPGERADAERALGAFLVSQSPVRPAGPRDPSEILIADVLHQYITEHARETAAPERIGYAVKALLPFWGDKPASAVTGNTCRAYGRYRGTGPGTVRRELGTLQAALRHCEREGSLTRAPAVTLPARPAPRERWLTRDEVARLIRAARQTQAREWLPYFILLAVYTGSRKEAVLSLQWLPNTTAGWVDIERREIAWRHSRTKKQNAVRTPLPRQLLFVVTYLRRRTQRYVLEWMPGKRVHSLKNAWNTARRLSGLHDVTPHTLRHTAATWLAQSGVPLWQAAGYLGMTKETLEGVYAHHSPDHMREAVRALERRRG